MSARLYFEFQADNNNNQQLEQMVQELKEDVEKLQTSVSEQILRGMSGEWYA